MNSLITVMNKLQDVFSIIGTSHKVDLPQIIVVGSQSSGKSSVLESLVGKSFLPRGTGIVTRAPLILHLINSTKNEVENSTTSKTWAVFLHKPNEIYHDFDKVREEIEHRTQEIAGEKKNITNTPIVLNVYSELSYDLSFVDLPGLTKVPVGDQPDDIEVKIKDLVLDFIKNPNSIILAVVTANTDPATSESLHIAKSVDPNGDRTLAVVTKIDLMDAGTDATELLCGKIIPVKLGIIGVINRSQKDIKDNKSIEQSLEAEQRFFARDYPEIANHEGTIVLMKRLQLLLIQKIKDTCPVLKKQLNEINSQYGSQLKQFKEFTDNYDRSLLELITQTSNSYKACLDGLESNMDLTEINVGASIAKYFKTNFVKDIDAIDPLHGLSTDAIMNIVNNAAGTSMGIFMPREAFDHLVKKQLKLMENPALACVDFVHEELMSNIYRLEDNISRELQKYPKLMKKITEVLQEILGKYKLKASDAVSKLIRYQEAFINSGHPDFISAVIESDEYNNFFLPLVKKNEKNNQPEENVDKFIDSQEDIDSRKNSRSRGSLLLPTVDMRECVEKSTTNIFFCFADSDNFILQNRAKLITLFMNCYFKVIKKIIQDTVPKIIMCEMVNNVKNNFQKYLTSKVYKSNDVKMAELLLESPKIVDERIKAHSRFNASENALKLMREIEQICRMTDKNT